MAKVTLKRDFAEFKKGDEVDMSPARAARLKKAGIVETATLANTGGEGRDKAGALKGINFASDEAAEFAAESNLTAKDFKGVTASGANGYTKGDVKKIVASLEE